MNKKTKTDFGERTGFTMDFIKGLLGGFLIGIIVGSAIMNI